MRHVSLRTRTASPPAASSAASDVLRPFNTTAPALPGHDFGRVHVHAPASMLLRQVPETGTSTEAVPAGPGAETAPACPVSATGTLSEVSWGETSGLYPSSEHKYQPDKWDPAKLCELLKTRGAVHEVGKRGEKVHKSKPRAGDAIEQMLAKYHYTENFPAVDSEIADAQVKWFYLSPDADKPAAHPSAKGSVKVKSYGAFHNVGGGDVKKGDTYIHFYKLGETK